MTTRLSKRCREGSKNVHAQLHVTVFGKMLEIQTQSTQCGSGVKVKCGFSGPVEPQ